MTSPFNREEETKQKLKVLVLNFAKGYVGDGDMEKELEAMKWAEEFIDQYAQQVAIEARIDENKSWKRRIGEHSDEDTSYYDNRIAELEKERKQE